MELKRVSAFAETDLAFALARCAVALAQAAHDVKLLKRKAGGIHLGVTRRTAFLAAVFGQLFANGFSATNGGRACQQRLVRSPNALGASRFCRG